MFIGGVCCCLSGFLEFFPRNWTFVFFAVLIRIVHATGNAFVITATFTFTAVEFQNSIGKIFVSEMRRSDKIDCSSGTLFFSRRPSFQSWTRATMNLAQMFGPTLGGALYGLGGFYVPFVAMGCVQVVMSAISIPLLPECQRELIIKSAEVIDNVELVRCSEAAGAPVQTWTGWRKEEGDDPKHAIHPQDLVQLHDLHGGHGLQRLPLGSPGAEGSRH